MVDRLFIPSAQKILDGLQSSIVSSDVSVDEKISGTLCRYFYPLRIIMNNSLNILAGGAEESQQLKALFLEKEYDGWNKINIIENAKKILNHTKNNSDTDYAIKALLVKSFGSDLTKKYLRHGNRSIKIAHNDFANIETTSELLYKKKDPSGKSCVTDNAILNSLEAIVESALTTAWSMKYFIISDTNVI